MIKISTIVCANDRTSVQGGVITQIAAVSDISKLTPLCGQKCRLERATLLLHVWRLGDRGQCVEAKSQILKTGLTERAT